MSLRFDDRYFLCLTDTIILKLLFSKAQSWHGMVEFWYALKFDNIYIFYAWLSHSFSAKPTNTYAIGHYDLSSKGYNPSDNDQTLHHKVMIFCSPSPTLENIHSRVRGRGGKATVTANWRAPCKPAPNDYFPSCSEFQIQPPPPPPPKTLCMCLLRYWARR